MADINISNYSSQEVREYVSKFDTNGDGKINEGKELQALLAGSNEQDGDTLNISSRKKVLINDPYEVVQAIESYNSKSPEERQKVVNITNTAMTAKLETLEQIIDNASNYPIQRNLIGMKLGITYTKERFAQEFMDAISDIQNTHHGAMENIARAFDRYVGNDLYEPVMMFFVDPDSIASDIGYESFDSFLDDYMQNFDKKFELEDKFFDAVDRELLSGYIDEANTRLNGFKNGYENAKPLLDKTVNDGITNDNQKELSQTDFVTARTFEDSLLLQYAKDQATSIDFPKVKVDGQEYEVGKKYQEQGPDGKPRIVSYDRLGNKWDVSHGGVKVND